MLEKDFFEEEIIYENIKGILTENQKQNCWNFFNVKIATKIYQLKIEPINNTDKEILQELEQNKEEVFLSIAPCFVKYCNTTYTNSKRIFLNTKNGEKIPIKHNDTNFWLITKFIGKQNIKI